ncbi:MAG: (2Fe-2S)-binding protein [Spirochaetales bacterium]|nr:(2Fe-2S)-binding protein [Spirochaetales bacterium]
MTHIRCRINGQEYERSVSDHRTLLHFLRDDLGLTGTKEGCGAGECGACTVIVDGQAVNSCLVLAAEIDGAVIETIEGEARGGELTAVQDAFDRHHAVQCGFCTSGMIMTVKDLLRRVSHPTRDEVIEGIEGNFCRCTGYEQIIEAVLDAAANGATARLHARDKSDSAKENGHA